MQSLSCPNRQCPPSGKGNVGAIIRHGFYTTRWGKRRRYRCRTCGKTFCSTTGTPYYRLQHRRSTFDEVASLSVEGFGHRRWSVVRVERRAVIGAGRLTQALRNSEDSVTLNTSFVERLNLTTGLVVSGSTNDLSGPVQAISRRSSGVSSLPLQSREASPGLEIWTGSQDTSPTGWVDPSGR
jgi:hypothetical protein